MNKKIKSNLYYHHINCFISLLSFARFVKNHNLTGLWPYIDKGEHLNIIWTGNRKFEDFNRIIFQTLLLLLFFFSCKSNVHLVDKKDWRFGWKTFIDPYIPYHLHLNIFYLPSRFFVWTFCYFVWAILFKEVWKRDIESISRFLPTPLNILSNRKHYNKINSSARNTPKIIFIGFYLLYGEKMADMHLRVHFFVSFFG